MDQPNRGAETKVTYIISDTPNHKLGPLGGVKSAVVVMFESMMHWGRLRHTSAE